MSAMRLVIKISGHLISSSNKVVENKYIDELVDVLNFLYERGHKMIVVIGGGEIARRYINVLNVNESLKDLVGIYISRLNALLVAYRMINISYSRIPVSIEEVIDNFQRNKIIFLGGLQPGQSTTTVAALCAEVINAEKLILTTTVNGIYTVDPNINPDAKLLRKVNINNIFKYIRKDTKAGTYPLLDELSVNILKRSKIPVHIVNGNPPYNIIRAIKNENIGTIIVY